MKRVLITGCAGFVGSHIVEHLLQKTDWEIVGLDSFKHRGDSLRLSQDPRVTTYGVDLSAPLSRRLKAKLGPIDFILNVASESHVDRSIDEPVPFVQNNVDLALTMLELAREVKPKAFVQVSTDEVYGAAPIGVDHVEWSTILPSNPYAASKAAQEAIAISYWRTYGVPLIITNTMNMFGQRQDPEKYIPMLIQKLNKGEKITIHGSHEYIGTRFYLHARNFADALLFLLTKTEPTLYYDSPHQVVKPARYHIVGEREIDNLELAQMVSQVMGKNLYYELVDFHRARPGHDRRYALDGSKIAALGWKQPQNLEESLKKTVEWTLEHKEWLL